MAAFAHTEDEMGCDRVGGTRVADAHDDGALRQGSEPGRPRPGPPDLGLDDASRWSRRCGRRRRRCDEQKGCRSGGGQKPRQVRRRNGARARRVDENRRYPASRASSPPRASAIVRLLGPVRVNAGAVVVSVTACTGAVVAVVAATVVAVVAAVVVAVVAAVVVVVTWKVIAWVPWLPDWSPTAMMHLIPCACCAAGELHPRR